MRLLLRRSLGRVGLELRRAPPVGVNLDDDLRQRFQTTRPLVFDIGANVGQFLTEVRRDFPQAVVHAFEPSPEVFQTLRRAAAKMPNVTLNQVAMGARCEERILLEHSDSVASSLLAPGPDAWGESLRKTLVPVETVDAYCAKHEIRTIDLLKIDAQGYDLEVLRGAADMLSCGSIQLVLVELTFRPIYQGMAEPGEIYHHLRDRGFRLVSLYRWWYTDEMADSADALFVLQKSRQ